MNKITYEDRKVVKKKLNLSFLSKDRLFDQSP